MLSLKNIDDNFIYVKADAKTGASLGGVYSKAKQSFRIPLNLYSLREVVRHCEGKDRETIIGLGVKLRKESDEILASKSADLTEYIDPRLRHYQNQDVFALSFLKNKAIFNEQRTGKTPTTIIALREQPARRILVVCPTGLRGNWEREFSTWLDRPSQIISGTAKQRHKLIDTFNVYDDAIGIVSYESLRNDIAHYTSHFDAMVVDEAHRLRNYKSLQSNALFKIGRLAQSRYALTGTPAVNHAVDVYGILAFLYPEKYPSYWQFAERYFEMEENYFSQGQTVGSLRKDREPEWLWNLSMTSIQRKRKDIMDWLPEIQTQVIELEPNEQQLKEYNQMKLSYTVGEVDAQNQLVQLIRLRQIALAPQLLNLKGKSPKIDFLMEYIDDDPTSSIVIFSNFTSFLNLLSDKLKCKHGLLTGATKNQSQVVADFQEGRFNVLLSNIRVGGVGHTMDRADAVIFTDRSFSPMENDQAQDRLVPISKERVTEGKIIIDLVTKGTVDTKVLQLLQMKQDIIKYTNDYGLASLL